MKNKETIKELEAVNVEKAIPSPGTEFTDTARLKVCLDVEINLSVNGQKVKVS